MDLEPQHIPLFMQIFFRRSREVKMPFFPVIWLSLLSTLSPTKSLSSLSQKRNTLGLQKVELMGRALEEAGTLTAGMASRLPKWYSSKEGLTGESPAVFGAGGIALSQAGQALLLSDEEEDESSSLLKNSVYQQLQCCACDLAGGRQYF